MAADFHVQFLLYHESGLTPIEPAQHYSTGPAGKRSVLINWLDTHFSS
jgi:hypothetical protein